MELFSLSSSGDEILCVDRFIGDENCNLLCEKIAAVDAPSSYSSATSLILRGNCLGPRGAQSLSRMLSKNNSLSMISLEWNQLGTEGAIYLSNSLPKNNSLQYLDLKNNGITNEGASALAIALLQNSNLMKLDLRWNQIGDDGAKAFEAVYRSRTTQFTLFLNGNLLSPSMMDLIDEWNTGTIRLLPTPTVRSIPPPANHNIELDARIRELKKENEQLGFQLKESLHQCADLNRQVHVSALRITELEQSHLRQMHWITQLEENLRQAKVRLTNQTSEYEMAVALWQREREEMQEKYAKELSEFTNSLKVASEDCLSLRNLLTKSKESYDQLSIQQERMRAQHKTDLAQLQEELKQSQIKCSELQVSESQAVAKAQSESSNSERLKMKLETTEEELELIKKQSLHALEIERNRCTDEIERMRHAFTEKLAEGHEREVSLSQEISTLQATLSDSFLKISSFELTLKQSCEEAAKEGRETERARGDRIAENLRQRLEAAESFQKSAEERCSNLEIEAKDSQSKLTIKLNSVQSELQMLREELSKLRAEKKILIETIQNLEIKSEKLSKEKELLQSKFSVAQDKITTMTSQIHHLSLEVDKYKDMCTLKDEELKHLQLKNAEELRMLSTRITEAVARELTR